MTWALSASSRPPTLKNRYYHHAGRLLRTARRIDVPVVSLSSGDGDVIRGQRTILRGSGGIFFGIVVGPDLIRGGYYMQRYVLSYVCMYVSNHHGL